MADSNLPTTNPELDQPSDLPPPSENVPPYSPTYVQPAQPYPQPYPSNVQAYPQAYPPNAQPYAPNMQPYLASYPPQVVHTPVPVQYYAPPPAPVAAPPPVEQVVVPVNETVISLPPEPTKTNSYIVNAIIVGLFLTGLTILLASFEWNPSKNKNTETDPDTGESSTEIVENSSATSFANAVIFIVWITIGIINCYVW